VARVAKGGVAGVERGLAENCELIGNSDKTYNSRPDPFGRIALDGTLYGCLGSYSIYHSRSDQFSGRNVHDYANPWKWVTCGKNENHEIIICSSIAWLMLLFFC